MKALTEKEIANVEKVLKSRYTMRESEYVANFFFYLLKGDLKPESRQMFQSLLVEIMRVHKDLKWSWEDED